MSNKNSIPASGGLNNIEKIPSNNDQMQIESPTQLRLEACTDKDIPFWCFSGECRAKCTKVYDGDTCHLIIEYNNKLTKIKVRMLGYDAPEIKSPDENVKKIAIQARDKLHELIFNKIVKCHLGDFDKYGRVLCNIYTEEGIYVNEYMAKNYGIYGRPQYNNFD